MRGVGGGRAQGTREERRGGRPKTLSPHSRSLHLKATGSIIGHTMQNRQRGSQHSRFQGKNLCFLNVSSFLKPLVEKLRKSDKL